MLLAAVGVALLVAAVAVPLRLLGLTLAIEGVLVLSLAAGRPRLRRLAPSERLLAEPEPREERIGAPVAVAGLTALTLLALVVRLVNLDGDLWLDEIVTVREYASRPVREILSTYGAANNHLLNSLLVHVSLEAFGYREWAIRLPALLAGVLTVPATYWTGRLAFGRGGALASAAAVAVAYQHVFFSQSARGYAPYLLGAVLSSGLLVVSLRSDRLRAWALFVVAAVVCVASVPTGAFVVVGQALVVATLIGVRRRRGAPVRGSLTHAGLGFGAVALLVLQVYSGVAGQAGGVAQGAWKTAEAGFRPLSRAFLDQITTAAGAGSGSLVLLAGLGAAALAAVGAVSLARRATPLLAALVLGPTLHLAFAAVQGLVFSPRFLILWLFPAVFVAVETIDVVTRRIAGRHAGVAFALGAVALCAVLAAPLRVLHDVPKQDYRGALAVAKRERAGGVVVAIYTAESGVRYYGVEHASGRPLSEGTTFAVARTAARLRAIERDAAGRRLVLVTTFPRALRAGRPSLDRRVRQGWRPIASLDGAVGDGEVIVWAPRIRVAAGRSRQ